jgi:gamma-glutamylcyclotransferase (GGCT)/AIG2-like uncharacterized protein YtfP
MTLHFAYGSNMHRGLMRRRCRTAIPLGLARLPGFRFIVSGDGYASVVPARGRMVHGVLWRLKPRDLAALNAYESIDSGLYERRTLSVIWGSRRIQALVFVGREEAAGRPRPGYQEIIVAAALDWKMPDDYVRELARWSPTGFHAARGAETGEMR